MEFLRLCRRWLLPFVAAASVVLVVAPVASANNQAGRIVTGGFTIRGVRSQIYHQTTWELPSGATAESMWVGAQNTIGNPELVQDGLIKATTQVPGCGGLDTNGVVKTFYYWVNHQDSVLDCIFGQNVSKGEKHTFKVQRCNNSNSQWCTFIDGTQVGQPRDIGLSTAPWAETIGEYSACLCGSSIDDIDGIFGGSDAANKWDVTDCGTSCSNPT